MLTGAAQGARRSINQMCPFFFQVAYPIEQHKLILELPGNIFPQPALPD